MREMAQSSRFFFVDFAQYDEKGARKHLGPASAPILGEVIQRLASLTEWEVGAIHDVVAAVAESHDLKLGKVAQPIRVAVSGGTISPPIDQTLAILGRQRTLERLEKARAFAAGSGHAAGDVIKD